jgi:hypothetical protein
LTILYDKNVSTGKWLFCKVNLMDRLRDCGKTLEKAHFIAEKFSAVSVFAFYRPHTTPSPVPGR